MNQIFDRILLRTNPPASTPPEGTLALTVENGRLVVEGDAGANQSVGTSVAGTPVNGVTAKATLTSTGTAPSNGQTVTIGSVVYTFQTTLTNVANNVLIGVSAAVALDNLKSAINRTAGAGTTYAAATVAHPQVTATTNTDTTQLVEGLNGGTWANGIVTSENSATLSWGGNLAGGVNATPAKAGDKKFDGGYEYLAIADVTLQSVTGWRRTAHSSF